MKLIVGVADMKISDQDGDVIVTHALGSCLGIAVHDPVAKVGGLLHVMMPTSDINPDKARVNPYLFVDTGVPAFFQQVFARGGLRGRLEVRVAGGANVQGGAADRFAVGKRNYTVLRKMFWKNGVMIKAEDVGGTWPRTMYLEVGTGRVWLSTGGTEKTL